MGNSAGSHTGQRAAGSAANDPCDAVDNKDIG